MVKNKSPFSILTLIVWHYMVPADQKPSFAKQIEVSQYTEWFTIKSTQRTLPYTLKFSTSKFVLFTTNLHFRQQRAPNFAKFWSGKLWGIGKGSLSWFYCKSFCIFVKNEEFCIFWHQEKDFSLIFCIFCIFLKTPYLTRRIWGETGCT
jgi:hypothetical protein